MVGRRGGIKSAFLPYIHDVAFQKMVIEGAYPEFRGRVQAYLMMPDKSKRTSMTNLNGLVEDAMRGEPRPWSRCLYKPWTMKICLLWWTLRN